MLFNEGRYEPGRSPSSVPLVWMLAALFGSAAVGWLSLPSLPQFVLDPLEQRDVFRPEWFVAGTFLVLPVFYASRSSWWLAVPTVLLPGAQMLYVAATAAERLRLAGAGGLSGAWLAVGILQATLFLVVGTVGARRDIRDRRVRRMLRAMAGLDLPQPRIGEKPSDAA